ncbi:unnamed protein product [Phytophthora fragariaefolia]|uniref:Unnamed protein product n=1 Tax=Phytophthora fragariaefolia TaxID=1490495 RepID=A0A9W6XA22_9STRA|nr:unnamed protein product [Phytophthora fragariaefolia]
MRPELRVLAALLLLLLLLALCGVRGIVTPDAPASAADAGDSSASQDAEPAQNEAPAAAPDASAGPRRIAEPDEPRADAELADEDVDPLLDVPGGLFEVVDADSVDARKRQNYASLDAGATILDAAPETKSPTNLLVPDKDRVFGRTFTQVISQLEKSIDAEVEALEAQAVFPAPQLSALPASAEVSVPRIPDPTELTSQCLMEKNNTVVAVFYDEPQRIEHYHTHGMCCLVDYTPEMIEAEVAASSVGTEHVATATDDAIESDAADGAIVPPGSLSNGASTTNASASTNGSSANATVPSNTAAPAPLQSGAHNAATTSTQGLGRLESIFVRITKKSKHSPSNVDI